MGSRSDLTWGTKRTYGERWNEGADVGEHGGNVNGPRGTWGRTGGNVLGNSGGRRGTGRTEGNVGGNTGGR
jgi:hypothetical protein